MLLIFILWTLYIGSAHQVIEITCSFTTSLLKRFKYIMTKTPFQLQSRKLYILLQINCSATRLEMCTTNQSLIWNNIFNALRLVTGQKYNCFSVLVTLLDARILHTWWLPFSWARLPHLMLPHPMIKFPKWHFHFRKAFPL